MDIEEIKEILDAHVNGVLSDLGWGLKDEISQNDFCEILIALTGALNTELRFSTEDNFKDKVR